ncbi:hypothetical protein B0H11DRAFT_2319925 [Mycena galericulata]|nr:hypothetical protein B0H11DRAFT_2319925 [Mycena galericulata]
MAAPSNPTHESYLIIGGGNSLGETIVEELLGRGETRVSIFDAQPLAAEQAARFGDSVRVCVGDILAPGVIAEALKSTSEELLSLRAEAVKVKELVELSKKINTDGMRNLLAAALESGSATQLLYVGNPDIVFDGRDRPLLREADAPYPVKCWVTELEGRHLGERMVLSFNGVNALRTAVIRPAAMFGPSWSLDLQLRRIQTNPVIVSAQIGENTNRVDHTYVANAAHAAVFAADRLAPAHPKHAATAGRAFFISDGDPRPFWDLLRALWTNVGGTLPKNGLVVGKSTAMLIAGVKDMVGNLQGENREMWKKTQFLCASRSYDISLAREVLGYEPIVSHDEGIRRTAEWWLERQLMICKGKKAVTEAATENTPPPYDREEAFLLTEKSPFF